MTAQDAPNEQYTAWEEPAPLVADRTLPRFPAEALPDWLHKQVTAVAEATQTPTDLPGCVALAALSTAAGGRAIARIRPGWDEPVNIYTVVSLPPASRKTPVFRAMTAPIVTAEHELAEQARPAIEQARLERMTAESAREKAEKAAVRSEGGDDRDTALSEALDAALTAHAVDVPAEPRLIVDDITPEEAATLLASQHGRIAVLSAEGGIFDTLAGRYSGTPNLTVFLKGHGGDLLLVDRKGRPPERVDNPALTLGLTVQPAVIDDLGRTALFRGTGLLARFLYSLPHNTIGARLADPPPVPDDVADTYDRYLRLLVHGLHEWTDPAVFAFTPEANQVLIEMHDEIEPKLDPKTGEWAHIGDWAGKQVGQTARLAALLHAAQHPQAPWDHAVEESTARAAKDLGDYFAQHALAVFDRIGADPAVDSAHTILDWIARHQPEHFTQRDIRRSLGRHFKQAEALNAALNLLEEHGHIASVAETHTGRGRPRSPTYWTHPRYRR